MARSDVISSLVLGFVGAIGSWSGVSILRVLASLSGAGCGLRVVSLRWRGCAAWLDILILCFRMGRWQR